MVPLIFWNVFYSRLLNYTMISFLNIFKAFFTILLIMAAQQFFSILSSHNSISETNNQVRVFGEINERYEAYCDVRMYVCMCRKGSFNDGQMLVFFVVVFIHKTKWVNMVFSILNIEGQQNCMTGSKVKNYFTTVFSSKSSKTLNIGMLGVYPRAMDCNIALHTHISFWVSVSEKQECACP